MVKIADRERYRIQFDNQCSFFFILVPEFGFNCAPLPFTFTGSEARESVEVTIGILNGVVLSLPATLQFISLMNVADNNPASTSEKLGQYWQGCIQKTPSSTKPR